MTPWLAGKLALPKPCNGIQACARATHADQLWLRSADLASRMGSRDSGRARLRPSRMAPWLAGKLALPKPCNGIQACARAPHTASLWLRSADFASRMGSRDPGRARLRPSRMAPWLAGKLALPKPCNGIQAWPQPIRLHIGFVRQISRAEWARVIPGGRGSVRAGWRRGSPGSSRFQNRAMAFRRAPCETHPTSHWLRSADFASRMGSRDPGRARLRPSRMAPWLAGKRASKTVQWHSGVAAQPVQLHFGFVRQISCADRAVAQPIRIDFGFVRQFSRADARAIHTVSHWLRSADFACWSSRSSLPCGLPASLVAIPGFAGDRRPRPEILLSAYCLLPSAPEPHDPENLPG